MSVLAADTFQRANQSGGWGTASGGGTWTLLTGSPTLSISSNEGVATGLAANVFTLYLGSTSKDAEALIRLSNSDFSNNDTGIYLRLQDTNNFYVCFLGTGSFYIDKKVAGTYTSGIVTSSATTANNTFYWIRFRIQGSLLLARFWQDGTAEPNTWQLTVTDTGLAAAGHVGIGGYQQNSTDTVSFDHFYAVDYPWLETLTATDSLSPTEVAQWNEIGSLIEALTQADTFSTAETLLATDTLAHNNSLALLEPLTISELFSTQISAAFADSLPPQDSSAGTSLWLPGENLSAFDALVATETSNLVEAIAAQE